MQSDTPVLILPGIGNSGPQHWQTLWELHHPQWQRVNLGDWDGPVCEDWVRTLDVAVQTCSFPPVLVAHWAHHSALVRKAEEETEARARSWMADGEYSILLARDGVQPESLGFLALYESFALYTALY